MLRFSLLLKLSYIVVLPRLYCILFFRIGIVMPVKGGPVVQCTPDAL